MEQTINLPRRLDKQWRHEYDIAYRARTKSQRKAQAKKYRSRPEIKEQMRARTKTWYDEHKPIVIARRKAERETIDGKIYQWKLSAKRRNIKWNLTPEFVKSLPMVCHYTGLPLTLKVGGSNTLSIDRIDSKKPYEEGNMVPCCTMINAMKREFNKSEFIEMCRKVTLHQKSNE